LCHAVPHRSAIRSFRKVTEICLSLALILLLAANVLDFDIQITKPTREHRDVGAVMIQVGPGLTDDEIKVEADVCRRTKPGAGIAGRQTDGVISRVVRSKREAAVGRTTRIDDRMATFNLRDLHQNAQLCVIHVSLLFFVPFQCAVVALDYGVGGHFLDEAPFLIRVEIEVEGIHGRDEKK